MAQPSTFGLAISRLKDFPKRQIPGTLLFAMSSTFTIISMTKLLTNRSSYLNQKIALNQELSSKQQHLKELRFKFRQESIESINKLQREKQESANIQEFFNSIPFVSTSYNPTGRLVGFNRLIDQTKTAQYVFAVKNGDSDVEISGIIAYKDGRLYYNDDSSTPYELRTSGEVSFEKLNPFTLQLRFIVLDKGATKHIIGDTMIANFNIGASKPSPHPTS